MLTGTYEHTIDAKGRVILPADLRAALGEHFFITKGLDQCLSIYGENEWAELEQKLRKLPITDPNARKLVRLFSAAGRQLECDRQGRFLVPGNLRFKDFLKPGLALSAAAFILSMILLLLLYPFFSSTSN